MQANPRLKDMLKPYSPKIQNLFLDLRGFVIETVQETNELIWDNYNALAIAYSKSEQLKDAFCHLALYSKHVNFGFNRATELQEIPIKLLGQGKLIRHLTVTDMTSFPKTDIRNMLKQAVELSEYRNPILIGGVVAKKSIIKSVSEKKRRP